ncbi:MAG TPA: transposase [Anaerolineales bacterium]|nr:transposase [Anaerolineales bacterium]
MFLHSPPSKKERKATILPFSEANGQVGVYLGYASRKGYSLIEGQLFMPEKWFEEEQAQQREECGVREDLVFKTEPEIGAAFSPNFAL